MAKLTVLMGAPGAGKSTYAAQFQNVVSTDRQGAPGDILHEAYRQLNTHLGAGRDVVFDTTGANPAVRKAAVTIAKKYGAQVDACVLDTSANACVQAQKARSRPVAETEVRRIHDAIQRQVPNLKSEGFQSVRTARGRK